MQGFAIPLGALMGQHEEQPEEKRPLHEAQIMELRALLEREQRPNPFKVGDLVTPIKDGQYINHGEPFIVIEIIDPPVRLPFTEESHSAPDCYAPHDLRVGGLSRGGQYMVWLQRSQQLEPYTGEPVSRA